MSTTPARQPAGVPVGGQFAAKSNPEPEVELDDVAGTPVTPDFGAPFGGTAYTLPGGQTVTMWRKGQRVRFYDESGSQVGPEQSNVAPAVAYAHANGWDAAMGPSDSSAFWTQHVDSADIDPTSVSGQLQAADAKFDRPATPAVFAEYQEFVNHSALKDGACNEVISLQVLPNRAG